MGESGSCSDGRAMFSKSLIQFSVERWGCVPFLFFDLIPNCGGGNEDSFKRPYAGTVLFSASDLQ